MVRLLVLLSQKDKMDWEVLVNQGVAHETRLRVTMVGSLADGWEHLLFRRGKAVQKRPGGPRVGAQGGLAIRGLEQGLEGIAPDQLRVKAGIDPGEGDHVHSHHFRRSATANGPARCN